MKILSSRSDSWSEKSVRTLGDLWGEASLGITITDPNRRILYSNMDDARMHGYTVDELLGQDVRIFAPRENWKALRPNEVRGFKSFQRESVNVKKDGSPFPVFLTSEVIVNERGDLIGVVTTCKDISEPRKGERALWESELRFHTVAQTATDAIILSDSAGSILFWNKAAERIFGYKEAEIMYQPIVCVIPERYREEHLAGLLRLRQTGKARVLGRTMELFGLRKDGSECPIEISIGGWRIGNEFFFSAILRDIGQRKGYEDELRRYREQLELIVQSRTLELEEVNKRLQNEVLERKRAEESLAELAFYDSLTGLPNRVLLQDRLNQAFYRGRRKQEYLFAILYLDLDRFKEVNDRYGHHIGDRVLKSVARKLESCVRPEDTVARIGGDEFVVLVEDVRHSDYVYRVALRIQDKLDKIEAGVSIGIAFSGNQFRTPHDLMKHADLAMYEAKAARRLRLTQQVSGQE